MKVFLHPSYLLLAALLAVAPSCGKAGPERPGGGVTEAVVHIQVGIDEAPVATKAMVDFANGARYGIFACTHEASPATFVPFNPACYNVRANRCPQTSGSDPDVYYYPEGWGYNYVYEDDQVTPGTLLAPETFGTNTFTLTQRRDDQHADLYAYAPWVQEANVSGPTAIPFETEQQLDLLYAQENGSANRDLDPASGPLAATFTFKHAMARLVFRFKLRYTPGYYYISTVKIARQNTAAPSVELWESGDFDAVTGTFVDNAHKQVVDELSLSSRYPTVVQSKDSWASVIYYIVPTEITADDELHFSFETSGQVLQPYVLKKAHVKHDGVDVYGFQAGYTYTFDFLLDNYLYLDGFSVNTTWTDNVPLGNGENI